MAIGSFIRQLAQATPPPNCQNFYTGSGIAARRCRHNLKQFLHTLSTRPTRLALIGEAPGYKGCRHTGLPFSSEHLVANGIPKLQLWGPNSGYRLRPASAKAPYRAENTATLIWQPLAEAAVIPLVWNAFPFHPHQPGLPESNRKPGKAEREQGALFLQYLLSLYPGLTHLVAVGRVAEAALSQLDLSDYTILSVRHPSFGGKRDYTAGLKAILKQI